MRKPKKSTKRIDTKNLVIAAKYANVDLSEERIKNVLWERFREAMSFVTDEAGRGDGIDNDDVNEYLRICGEETDLINQILGHNEGSVEEFATAFHRVHPKRAPEVISMHVPMTVKDRQKVIADVQKSCLTKDAKNAILVALKASPVDE